MCTVLLSLLSIPLPCLASESFTDDFATGPNTFYWRVYSNSPLYSVDITQGDVRFSKPVGGEYTLQYVGISFRPSLRGDFDVSADFRDAELTRVDGSPGNQVQLNLFLGSQAFLLVRSDEVTGGQNVHVWLNPPGIWAGARPMTNTAGRLRVRRMGIHAQAWFDNTLIYEADFTTADARAQLTLQNNHTRDAIRVTFDDFAITADALLVPAPSLRIERSGSDVLVSWPLLPASWVLEHTPAVASSPIPWSSVDPATYQQNTTSRYIRISIPANHGFYRLQQP